MESRRRTISLGTIVLWAIGNSANQKIMLESQIQDGGGGGHLGFPAEFISLRVWTPQIREIAQICKDQWRRFHFRRLSINFGYSKMVAGSHLGIMKVWWHKNVKNGQKIDRFITFLTSYLDVISAYCTPFEARHRDEAERVYNLGLV